MIRDMRFLDINRIIKKLDEILTDYYYITELLTIQGA